jgi:hypothetical protein
MVLNGRIAGVVPCWVGARRATIHVRKGFNMKAGFRFGVTSAAALALLAGIACSSEPAAENSIFMEEYYAAHGVRVALETVHEITWERVEDAFNYVITADGVEVGSNVGSRNFVIHDGPFQEVIIDAFSFRGDPRGQAELVSREPAERYVIYWDEARFPHPYVGTQAENGDGFAQFVQGVVDNPHVVWDQPDRLVTLLFGNGVEDDDRLVPSPFEFQRGPIIEHGPFLTLIRD